MKKILLKLSIFLLFIFSIGLFFPAGIFADPDCRNVSGTFTANNWPGGTIKVGCAGDTGTAGCTGNLVSLSPGQSYNFGKCTCDPWGMDMDNGSSGLQSGCVWVGTGLYLDPQDNGNNVLLGSRSMPSGCTLTRSNGFACGTNGTSGTGNFTIDCTSPTPVPTPSTYTWSGHVYLDSNNDCQGTSTPYQGAGLSVAGDGSGSTDLTGTRAFSLASGGTYTMTLNTSSIGSNVMSTCNDNDRIVTLDGNRDSNFFIRSGPTPTPISASSTLTGYVWIDTNTSAEGSCSSDSRTPYTAGARLSVSGPVSASGTTGVGGSYTFTLPNNTYTLTLDKTTIPGYDMSPCNDNDRVVSLTGNTSRHFYLKPLYAWTGRVWVDAVDCTINGNETAFTAGAVLNISGDATATGTTGASGSYIFNLLADRFYTMTLTKPNGYRFTVDNVTGLQCEDGDRNKFPLSGPTTSNFLIEPARYKITGNLFVDTNKDTIKNSGEVNYTAAPIAVTLDPLPSTPGFSITYPSPGAYSINGIPSGNYQVKLVSPNPLPAGYKLTFPTGGVGVPYYIATAGTCSWNPQGGDTKCINDGDYVDMNFGITNSIPWMQSNGLDMRFDRGFTNPIPQTAHSSCKDGGVVYSMRSNQQSTTPGILFIGDSTFNPATDLGFGQLSTKQWLVGGTSYSEIFRPTTNELKTSYAFMLNTAKEQEATINKLQTALNGCPNLSNCTTLANVAPGVYTTDSNGTSGDESLTITANTTTFTSGQDHLFLIDGNLIIKGAIRINQPSTATFSVRGNIIVDAGVGSPPTTCQPTTRDLEGLFSTDKSFILNSRADCASGAADFQMNIAGAIVVNAKRQGGNFDNRRDLCANNLNYPTLTISARPDFLINAPIFVKRPNVIWQEVAP